MSKKVLSIAAVLLLAGLTATAFAGPFTPGNLVVTRVGDGSAALSSAATPAFLQEFTVAGSPVQTLPLPTAVSGSNRRLTNSGSASSEGFLTLSVDGRYLTLAGYDAATGTASVAGTTSAAVNRVIGRVDWDGNIDTTTALTDAYSGGNIRSAVSTDGTVFWTGGSNNGARYAAALGSTTSIQLNTTAPTNIRVVNIYNSQLYTSAASGSFQGVGTVGTGLPTTAGQTLTLLPGFPTTSGPSAYDYWFANDSTLYVADDRTTGAGGVQKWLLSGGTWSLSYTLSVTSTSGLRGLAGTFDGSGNAVLYATTTQTNNNNLVTVTDTGAGSTFTTLASAGTNMAFRGVDFAPIPEPGTLMLLCLGGLALIRRR